MNVFLLLPAVPPLALYLAHELVPGVRYLAGAVRGRR